MSKLAIAIEGYIANDLTIREVTGHRVVDISVPHTPRKQVDGNWVDAGDTEWFRATFWDEHADAVMLSVDKGSLVTLSGGLKATTYERKDGKVGITLEVTFPVLAVVIKRLKRGQVAAEPGWNLATTEPTEPWDAEAPF